MSLYFNSTVLLMWGEEEKEIKGKERRRKKKGFLAGQEIYQWWSLSLMNVSSLLLFEKQYTISQDPTKKNTTLYVGLFTLFLLTAQ